MQAPAAGIVTLAEDDLYFTGGTVILDHGAGVSSTFLHLSEVRASVGDFLEAGEVFGLVGATGRVTGAHLDWRVNWFEVCLDCWATAARRVAHVNPASGCAATATVRGGHGSSPRAWR